MSESPNLTCLFCALNSLLLFKYNKLLSCCQIPSWICCNLEGNGKDACNDEFISSSVEMDVLETTSQEIDESICCNGETWSHISPVHTHMQMYIC